MPPSEYQDRRSFSRRDWIALGAVLLLGLVLRINHINRPSVDYLQWRETQTLMVARNFYQDGMNLFRPAVDWRGTAGPIANGTVGGTELFVTPFLTAVLYHITGVQHWAGRVFPVFFSLLGAAYFFRLLWRYYGTAAATLGAALLTVSPYFWYVGRLQMPEALVFASAMAALYHFDRWLWEARGRDYAAALGFAVLMLLGKPNCVVYAATFGLLVFLRFGWRAVLQPKIYVFAVVTGGSLGAFMAYSHHVLLPQTGLSFAQPTLLAHGRFLLDPGYYLSIVSSLWRWTLTPPVAVLAIVGIFLPIPRVRRDWFPHAWLFGGALLFLAMPGGCRANGYYQMIAVPPALMLVTRLLVPLLKRGRLLQGVAAATAAACIAACLPAVGMLYEPRHESAYHCGVWLRENTPEEALLLTTTPNPATLYFADRIGWTTWAETYGRPASFSLDWINTVRGLGATFVVAPAPWFDNAYISKEHGVRDALKDSFWSHWTDDFAIFYLGARAELQLPESGEVTFGQPEARKYLRGTWGPNQQSKDGETFVAMGPSVKSALRFVPPEGGKMVRLRVAGATPTQRITIAVPGRGTMESALPAMPSGAILDIPLPEEASPKGEIIFLSVAEQNEKHAGLILYSLEVQ